MSGFVALVAFVLRWVSRNSSTTAAGLLASAISWASAIVLNGELFIALLTGRRGQAAEEWGRVRNHSSSTVADAGVSVRCAVSLFFRDAAVPAFSAEKALMHIAFAKRKLSQSIPLGYVRCSFLWWGEATIQTWVVRP